MADVKISGLPDGSVPAGTDLFVAARAGGDVRLSWAQLLAASAGGSQIPSFLVTDDGTTTKAFAATAPQTVAYSGTTSSTVLQSVANAVDPLNGGTGGSILITKPTGGTGYRWAATVQLPEELTSAQHLTVICEPGVVFIPQNNTTAWPLFSNQTTHQTLSGTQFTDAATLTLNGSTGVTDGRSFPASGSVAVGGHLVAYTGRTGSQLTGCTYAGNAHLQVGSGTSGLWFVAVSPGSGGTAITVAVVVSGTNTALSVGVSSNAITVNLATDGSGTATSTAAQVRDAVRASAAAAALVTVSLVNNSGAGVGVMSSLSATALSTHFSIASGSRVTLCYANWRHTTFEFGDSVLDCTNLAGAGSAQSLWVGQLNQGGWAVYGSHLNMRDIQIRGGKLINGPNTRVHYPVYLATQHRTANEPVQNTIDDWSIVGQRCGTEATPAGACTAYVVAGTSLLDSFTVCNQYIDRGRFRDNEAFGTYSSGYVAITSIQVGGTAKTGVTWVNWNTLYGTNDLPVEIDNIQKAAYVTDNDFGDIVNSGALFFNFTGGSAANGMLFVHERNHITQKNIGWPGAGYLYLYQDAKCSQESYNGTIIDRDNYFDLSHVSPTVSANSRLCTYGAGGVAIRTTNGLHIISEGNTINLGTGAQFAASAGVTVYGWYFQSGTSGAPIVVSGGAGNTLFGSVANQGNFLNQVKQMSVNGPWSFRDPAWVYDLTYTGTSVSGQHVPFDLGSTLGTTLQGYIRLHVKNATGGTAQQGIRVGSTTNLTFPAPLRVRWDGSGLTTTTLAAEITYTATSNQGKVWFTQDSVFKIARALATPTYGGSTAATQNLTGHWCNAYVTGGTVSAISTTNTGSTADNRATGLVATGASVGVIPPEGGVVCTSTADPVITYVPIHCGPTP